MQVVYEGPDHVLIVGPRELSRGVPAEVSEAEASALLGLPGVIQAAPVDVGVLDVAEVAAVAEEEPGEDEEGS